ncbi:MAG: sensor histidine kinase [Bacteroidota bacterium]
MGYLLNLPEAVVRLLVTYSAQSVLGIVLFLIFIYFSKVYRRKFLRTWSVSWLAFSLYMMGLVVVTIQLTNRDSNRLAASMFTQSACFLQILFLLVGTYELITNNVLRRSRILLYAALTILVAVISVLPSGAALPPFLYFIRYGLRSFLTMMAFLVAGIVVGIHPSFNKGFAQRLLSISFLLFCLDQFMYFSVVVTSMWNHDLNIPNYLGLIDLLLISLTGLSMVMWLLEDERERLKKTNQELDKFLYSASHDLRAPIASILGLTYLGKVELGEEKARMYMGLIEERIKKLDLVIFDILSLARSKKFELKIETIDLNKLVDETVADVKFNKGAAAITLEYERSDSNVFQSDYSQMKIILSNLMANAVKYHNVAQHYPFIRIIFRRTNEKVEITVEDNGQGIPKESIPKIFEMFYRASEGTEGTGLGLYIVKEALSKIKGTIFVQSQYGKGSAFTIVLDNA